MQSDILTSAYIRIGSRLREIARRMLGDDDAVDDALQDAFIKLWTKNKTIESANHAEGLLVTTVRNLSVDRLRESAAHPSVTLTDSESETAADDNNEDLYYEISSLIDNVLSERDRTILYQRDRDQWDYEDIARFHSLSVVNVRAIISRGRRLIREQFNKRNS